MAPSVVVKVMYLHDGFSTGALFRKIKSPDRFCLSLPKSKWVGLGDLGPTMPTCRTSLTIP